jgi:hypothetical protein
MGPSEPPSTMVPTWRQWRGTLLIAAANLAVATTVALVTAVLALIVGDVLPIDGPWRFSGLRWTLLAVVLVLLVAAILWRSSVHRQRGTLVYVRLLDQIMNDWHVHAVDLAGRRRMALRPVTRWIDLRSHTEGGVIDVVGPCAELTDELRRTILAGRDDAGSTIAPNLLWPMAIAVGSELPPVKDLRMLELPGAHADLVKEEILFTPPMQPAPPGLVRDALGVEDIKAMPGHRGGAGRLGLLLAFGPSAQHMDPTGVFAAFGVGEYCRIRPSWMAVDLAGLTPDCFTGAQLAILAQALTEQIAHLKDKTGDRELVVAAAMPKALALAVGFGLAQSGIRFFADTHLLHFDSDAQSYLPMRVHPSQPTSLATAIGS